MSAITDKMKADAEQDCEAIVKEAQATLALAQDGATPYDGDPLPQAIARALMVIATRWRETGTALAEARRQGAKGRRDQLDYSANLVEVLAGDLRTWRAAADLAGVAVNLAAFRGPDEGEGSRPEGRLLATAGQLDPITELRWTSTLAAKFNTGMAVSPCTCHGLTMHELGEAGCLKGDGIANQAVAAMMNSGAPIDTAAIASDPATIHVTWNEGAVAAESTDNQISRDAQMIKDAVVTEPAPTSVPLFLSAGGAVPAASSGPSFTPAPLRIAPDPELRTLPRNLSHSALDQAVGCGMKYRLSRVDRLKHAERPSMALIGGIAFDAVANEIAKGNLPAGYQPAVAFRAELALAVAAREEESPQWPIESWHASRNGKEDYAWWTVAGAKMAEDYYAWHAGRLREGWKVVAVQARYESPTAGVPNIGYIDQVWWAPGKGYLIVDAKSGSTTPTPDQLMMYGTKLPEILAAMGQPVEGEAIRAAYYDARKAELGRSFDVGSAEVREEVEYRMESTSQTIAGWHRSGVFPANTNGAYGGCGSCSLKRVCPVGSKR